MTYRGTVRNGVVVLEEGAAIAEGEEVVVLSKSEATAPTPPPSTQGRELSSLSKALLKHAGTVPGLPADFAKNHDHYLYGTPKRD